MTLLLLALVGFGASFTKAAFGLGSGVLFAPVLALFMEPRLAVGMTAPVMFISSLTTLRVHWRRWHWPVLRLLLPAALVGLLAGSYFIAAAPAVQIRRSIGVVAVAFAVTQVARLRRNGPGGAAPVPTHSLALASLYGLIGGVVSGIAHSGGLLYSLYLLPRMDKVGFVASLTMTLMVVDTVRLLSFLYLHVVSPAHLLASALVVPVIVLGSAVGKRVNGRLSERGFLALVTALVMATGIALLLR